MRILVIGFTKIKYMPYMHFYLDNIDCLSNEVHMLFWNRDMLDDNLSKIHGIILHEFRCYQEDDVSKIRKILSFKKFRDFTLQTLKNIRFDFIIIMHSLPGVLIADELKRSFTERYILDYRDSTYETFLPFRKIISNLVKCSYATFVSSDAFRRLLPHSESGKIYTSHNLLIDSLAHRDEKEKYGIPSDKIRIAFWGFIRHEKINIEIIRKIAADNRFELHYYGREQKVALNLKKFVKGNNINNVFFHGEYKPEERYQFVRQTDIIHNIYCDKNTMLSMGNKYYDGVIFRIPQICMDGSFMAEKATKKGVGFACNPQRGDFTERIFKYYKSIDPQMFRKICDIETEQIYNEFCTGSILIRKISEWS